LKSSKETEEDADRSFLLSLLPHIKGFNEDQKLVFQSEVLRLIMQIKRGNYPPITPSAPPSGNIHYVPYSQCHSLNPRPTHMMYSHPQQPPMSMTDPGPSHINYNHPHQSFHPKIVKKNYVSSSRKSV
jgi:hypothetical protein